MKKLLIPLLSCSLIASCTDDDNNLTPDSDCGAIISLDQSRNDGGVVEKISLVACGADWDAYKDINIQSAIKITKGQSRDAATYLIATKTDTLYIRYQSGTVPQTTIDSFTGAGYNTQTVTLTGLERIKWP